MFNKKKRYPSPYVLVEEEQLVSQSSCILHLIYSFIEVVVYILNTIPKRDRGIENKSSYITILVSVNIVTTSLS